MSASTARTAWREATEDEIQAGGHPSIRRLGAYHRGQLEEEEEEEIRDHFLFCRTCRGLMLELVEFLDGDPQPARFSAEDLIAAWEQIQNARKAGPS